MIDVLLYGWLDSTYLLIVASGYDLAYSWECFLMVRGRVVCRRARS